MKERLRVRERITAATLAVAMALGATACKVEGQEAPQPASTAQATPTSRVDLPTCTRVDAEISGHTATFTPHIGHEQGDTYSIGRVAYDFGDERTDPNASFYRSESHHYLYAGRYVVAVSFREMVHEGESAPFPPNTVFDCPPTPVIIK